VALSLEDLLTQARRPRILVLGDVMLDRYVWGSVERISPEAPIPVLSVAKTEDRLGGAGNVAAMLAALEADVTLSSVVGNDLEGRRILELLDAARIETDSIVRLDDRPTTVKQRLLGRTQSRHPQQMVRIDREGCSSVERPAARALLACLRRRLDRVDLVVISDYGKGIFEDRLLAQMITLAQAAGVPVVADPAPNADYARYGGCACISPNRAETARALQRPIDTPEEGLAAAGDLLALGIDGAAVTLDRDGIAWADTRGNRRLFPVRPREVCDITGAGDMVTAALSYALASGADSAVACRLANLAASLEVQRLGVAPLPRDVLLAELQSDLTARPRVGRSSKIVTPAELRVQLHRRRAAGEQVAMTNGCFDLLHPGHVASLDFARRQADCLVVGLNSDRSVRRLKGPGRPILDQQARAAMLGALACVDYVVVFDETSVRDLVGEVLPDVLVKSAQYMDHEVIGHEIVERYGGRVVVSPTEADYSTTGLIERIQQLATRSHAVA